MLIMEEQGSSHLQGILLSPFKHVTLPPIMICCDQE